MVRAVRYFLLQYIRRPRNEVRGTILGLAEPYGGTPGILFLKEATDGVSSGFPTMLPRSPGIARYATNGEYSEMTVPQIS